MNKLQKFLAIATIAIQMGACTQATEKDVASTFDTDAVTDSTHNPNSFNFEKYKDLINGGYYKRNAIRTEKEMDSMIVAIKKDEERASMLEKKSKHSIDSLIKELEKYDNE